MHMTFWWDVKFDGFFFQGFDIKSTTSFILICILLAALATVFEWLKLIQAKLRQKELFLRAQQIRTICPPTTESSSLLLDSVFRNNTLNITLYDRVLLAAWDRMLWCNVQVLSYILMLTVMLYNGWMIIAIVLGSGLGYFIFGPCFIQINIKNCKIMKEAFCTMTCLDADKEGQSTPVMEGSQSAVSVTERPCHQTVVTVH